MSVWKQRNEEKLIKNEKWETVPDSISTDVVWIFFKDQSANMKI